MMAKCFVIGDVHGHVDRLEALLRAASILHDCSWCDGKGTIPCNEPDLNDYECWNCDGNGAIRTDFNTQVIQLGDLGHYGYTGSPTGDRMCWERVHESHWCDIILWGNHDRAVIDSHHAFQDYEEPLAKTLHHMSAMQEAGRIKLAYQAFGHLLTHAGLHKGFKYLGAPDKIDVFVDWINNQDSSWLNAKSDKKEHDPNARTLIDNISRKRGGWDDYGGILWRDAGESLYAEWPQVFGHSSKELVRCYENQNWCIDIGSKNNGQLAGMWLPDREIVQIISKQDKTQVQRFPA